MAKKPPFDPLIETQGKAIYSYLWRMLGDPLLAEDCLQEVFLRAFRAYDRLEEDANLRAWIYRIATNTALTTRGRAAKRKARTMDLCFDLPSPAANPLQQVIDRELLQAVTAAVESLPGKQRAAVMLRKYQECSYEEVAQVLGCNQATARAHVYQGLRKLREVVRAYEQEAEG